MVLLSLTAAFLVRSNVTDNIQIPTVAVTEQNTTEESHSMNIPVIVYTVEEADAVLAKLRGEHATPPAARATYVSVKNAHSDMDNTYYLACVICQEAGGDNEEIMLLVANVVMNRVESPHFPNTVYGVLTQKYQYGMMWKYGIKFPSWATEREQAKCYEVARRIVGGERVCPSNVVYQAEFVQGSGIYAEYPGFYFCYE